MTSVDIVETVCGPVETKPTDNPNLKQRRYCTTTWHLRHFNVVEIHLLFFSGIIHQRERKKQNKTNTQIVQIHLLLEQIHQCEKEVKNQTLRCVGTD